MATKLCRTVPHSVVHDVPIVMDFYTVLGVIFTFFPMLSRVKLMVIWVHLQKKNVNEKKSVG